MITVILIRIDSTVFVELLTVAEPKTNVCSPGIYIRDRGDVIGVKTRLWAGRLGGSNACWCKRYFSNIYL